MWKAIVSRRELLELLLAGQPVTKAAALSGAPGPVRLGGDEILCLWGEHPMSSLPSWIVVADSRFAEAQAAILSSPMIPSPLSSFSRLVRESTFNMTLEKPVPEREKVIDVFVGMSMIEAAIYSGGVSRIADITPAACKRTVSFCFGRALQTAHPALLPEILSDWLQVQLQVNQSSRSDLFRSVCAAFAPIFYLASEIYFGLAPSGPIASLCGELLEKGEPTDDSLREVGEATGVPIRRVLGQGTREERATNFQESLRLISSHTRAPAEVDVAACGFVASQIAPGSFEHMAMLADPGDPRLAGWYGLFASLNRDGAALRAYGGLGLRIRRDLLAREDFFAPPICDVALAELSLTRRIGVDSVARRLGHSNEILVELSPLVTCSFRFGHRAESMPRSERSSDLFEERVGSTTKQAATTPEALTTKQKIDIAISLLTEMSMSEEKSRPSVSTTTTKPKRKR